MRPLLRPPLAALLVTVACGGGDPEAGPSFALTVDPPPGAECIGVTGFEVMITVAGQPRRQETVLNAAPVLSSDECVLPKPVSVGGIEPDAALDIQVRGYDGVRQLLVSGSAHVPSLNEPGEARLELRGAGMSGRPVLTVNRTELFGKLDLGEITDVSVRTQQSNITYLFATIGEGQRPFFSVGEPTALTLTELPVGADDLVVALSLGRGGQKSARVTVARDASGLYLTTAPRN